MCSKPMNSAQGKCIIISAPSGAGKTTIVRALMERLPELAFSVSATSRPQRATETDGKDYHFLTQETFRAKVEAGELLEWEEVYPGRFYGTLKSEVERIWSRSCAAVFDVDVVGGTNLKNSFGDAALALFIAAPSLEVLEQRLRQRGSETDESLRVRVEKAAHEMTFAPRFDAVVVNADLDQAISEAYDRVVTFLRS